MKHWKIHFKGVPDYKKEKAEKTEQEECIENFRWFNYPIFAKPPESFISVVERKQRLNDPRYPEKCDQPGYEVKHLPLTNIFQRLAFGKYNTNYKEDNRLHQLIKLKSGNIIYKFKFFQTWRDLLKLPPDNIQKRLKLCRKFIFFWTIQR